MLCAATHGVLADAKMSQTPVPVVGAPVPPSGPTPPVPPSPVAPSAPPSLPCDGIGPLPLSMSPTGPRLEELVGAVLAAEELVGAVLPERLVALGMGLPELAPVPPSVVVDGSPLSPVLTMPPSGGPSSEPAPECEEPHANSSAARYNEEERRRRVFRRDREPIVAARRIQGLLCQEEKPIHLDSWIRNRGGRIRLIGARIAPKKKG